MRPPQYSRHFLAAEKAYKILVFLSLTVRSYEFDMRKRLWLLFLHCFTAMILILTICDDYLMIMLQDIS